MALLAAAAALYAPSAHSDASTPDDGPPERTEAADNAPPEAEADAKKPSALRFKLKTEVASGYLSSGGTLGDTWPITTQCLYWLYDLGEYGALSGYGWTISSLHDKQHDNHREAFNQLETALYYGYDWKINETFTLSTKGGALWNPLFGYEDAHNCSWGVHYVQSLDNRYLTPYINWLCMLRPTIRERARIGVSKSFKPLDDVKLTPFVETVWMDSRRYQSRYGGIPQDRFLGGAFATITTGVEVKWDYSESLTFFSRLRQYDVINSQSRRAVKSKSDYYAKNDWPVFGIGFELKF
jgi:hypothetical protein